MSFFRRMFFFLALNLLIVLMASIVLMIIINSLGIKGEWTIYIIFYSLIGFGGAFASLAMSRFLAKKFMGVQIIDPTSAQGQERELVDIVHEIATRARLPEKPEVGIYKSSSINAFATGPSKKRSLVAVSTGLLDQTNREQLEGIIAHEVAHIVNGDMVTMTLLQGLINTMVLLAAQLVTRLIVSRMRNRSWFLEYLIFIAVQIPFSILGSIVLCFYSRKREFRADKGGARLSSVENMISALKALQKSVGEKASAPSTAFNSRGRQEASYQYLQISGKGKTKLFSTHPPLEERIARLERLH